MYTDTDNEHRFAAAWKPTPGAELIGTVAEISSRTGSFGTYPIVTVREDSGDELAFHAFHTVAQNELSKLRPEVGAHISVRYDGKRTPKSGRGSYYSYEITMDRPAAEFSWDTFASDPTDVAF